MDALVSLREKLNETGPESQVTDEVCALCGMR